MLGEGDIAQTLKTIADQHPAVMPFQPHTVMSAALLVYPQRRPKPFQAALRRTR